MKDFNFQLADMIKMTFCVLFFFINIYGVRSQSINQNWQSDLSSAMDEFLKCEDTTEEASDACYEFIGKSLLTVYKVNDFYNDQTDRYLTVAEISDFLKNSENWTQLGPAYEQEALRQAQNLANKNIPAIAIYLNPLKIGHAVIILPGKLQPSGSWGFSVPNSTSFFPREPKKSYIQKGLSYAFGKNIIKDVIIYARKSSL